jgi:predicted solute-binding protein
LKRYYTENIRYHLDAEKRKGLSYFLSLLKGQVMRDHPGTTLF